MKNFWKAYKLHEYCTASSILKVWNQLANIDYDEHYTKFYKNSARKLNFKELIKKSTEFNFWINREKDPIVDYPVLYFQRLSLVSLPHQIGKFQKLETLFLNNNLLGWLPCKIGKLKKLQLLDLSYNKFTLLPKEIGELTELKVLRLGNNSLISLPKEIWRLTQLAILYLNNNSLTSLPSEIGKLSELQELNLNSNLLTSLPAEIGQLGKLKFLDLRENKSLTTLPKEIYNINNVKNQFNIGQK